MKRYLVLFALYYLLVSPALFAQSRCQEGDARCNFGVFPHSGFKQLSATYAPIVEDVSILIDVPVKFGSKSNFDSYEKALTQSFYDFALVGPMQYVRQAKPNGYRAVARSNRDMQFQFVVLPDSKVNQLSDLVGKKLGLVAPDLKHHLMAYSVVKKEDASLLDQLSIVPVKSPNGCLFALKKKKVDACGSISSILDIFKKKDKVEYKVIASSPELPGGTYVVHKDVDNETFEVLQDYFQERGNFIKADDQDYDVIRRLVE